ncbi:S-adenosylmethionine:tRNA ribosyltransferase-isomerase [Lunatimonas lonarensis]|uniref:S-adenosylmethionine:tRNA ribosyltransferase-isomerase n=1 Tax=Lunatimonas lonarensis TaxID=1232681 RepID=R7ZQV7_9BACT|nr:S-adenosylmethionine:tRNA ribosyltransferase-isomerase [Lunatimonas lonarensis]EON76500.1 S-adenosylmethionine:tRNA ribosyltransferase-isomerase [Lunatimonas lonarensis]
MADRPNLPKSSFWYELPEDRIAKYPLERRDASNLLWYKDQTIRHHRFSDLPDLLPPDSLMVFNNTKVIPARLLFQRETGSWIEIFLLKPIEPSTVIQTAMEETASTTWETMIGNLKRWKDGERLVQTVRLAEKNVQLTATLRSREERLVQLEWDSPFPFASIVEAAGKVPLPPYLNREATDADKETYQTVYSAVKGAVAAPTAGLHFTPQILDSIKSKGIEMDYLTLHVGAGTFQPISVENATEHAMHGEQMVFTADNLRALIHTKGKIVAVGTTSIRSLESLYWFGIKLMREKETTFVIPQDYPYRNHPNLPPYKEVFSFVLGWMEKNNKKKLDGETAIYIYPGYTFRVVSGLVTNFHQPGSTLILLIAAFTGENWREIYRQALENRYRFLSYGDSSLLWRE